MKRTIPKLYARIGNITWLIIITLIALVLATSLLLFASTRKEGFGTDAKLSLNYLYKNKTNKTTLNLYTITDPMLTMSSDKPYSPQAIPFSNPVRSNMIDMSGTENLWIVMQPTNNIDKFPKKFEFQIKIDMSLNNGYGVGFKKTKQPNTVLIDNTKNIGMLTLGSNIINIEGEGEIRDMNHVLYGTVKKTMDKTDNPSFVTYDMYIENMLIDMNNIVMHFGGLHYLHES